MMVRTVSVLLTLFAITAAAAAQSTPAGVDENAEREMVRLLNQSRASAGLPALTVDDRLTRAAREHSALQAQYGKLSHQFAGEPVPARRLATTGIRFNREGENVALDSGTAADAHDGLMHSPPHRANIMNPDYNVVGVGVVRKGSLIYVTEDFATRLQEYTPDEAENAAAQAFASLRERAHAPAAKRLSLLVFRNAACSMAEEQQLDTRRGLGLPGVRSVVTYTQGEPQKLPDSAVRLASDPTIKQFGVGGCYGRSPNYPSGTWWVVMAFY